MAYKPVKHTDSNKPWYQKKSFAKPYAIASKPKRKSYLIVCEGANTEIEYLSCIPAPNASVKFEGGCRSKKDLVQRALELRKREEYDGREVWCVYDMDYTGDKVGQKQDFNESIELARRKKMHVAYSNDAFELWFVLHYQPVDQTFLRFDYYRILSGLWGLDDYEEEGKRMNFCKKIYDLLHKDSRSSPSRAMERAKKLLNEHGHKPFADQNPCTTVFELIEALQIPNAVEDNLK